MIASDSNEKSKKPKKNKLIKKKHIRIGILLSGIIVVCTAIFFALSAFTSFVKKSVDFGTVGMGTDKWVSDINYLDLTIRQTHPNLFKHMKENSWDTQLENLKKDLPKLDDTSIKIKLSQIVAQIKDKNTNSNEYWQKLIDKNNMPIYIQKFGNEYRVVKTDKKYKNILGTKLISVNNVLTNKVLKSINTMVSNDYSKDDIITTESLKLINSYDILKYFDVVDGDNTVWKFQDDKKKNIEVTISKDEKFDEKDLISVSSDLKEDDQDDSTDSTDSDEQTKPYWYQYIAEDNSVYFRYDECIQNYSKTIESSEKYENAQTFFDKILNDISNKQPKKVIIDMRDNIGGRDDILRHFIDQAQLKLKNNKNIQFFAIISNDTDSAAILNTIDLKEKLNAKIIGQESGGITEYFESPTNITLPNSQMEIDCSTYEFDQAIYEQYPYYKNYPKGIVPDIKVDESFSDYKASIDDYYQAAVNFGEEKVNKKEEAKKSDSDDKDTNKEQASNTDKANDENNKSNINGKVNTNNIKSYTAPIYTNKHKNSISSSKATNKGINKIITKKYFTKKPKQVVTKPNTQSSTKKTNQYKASTNKVNQYNKISQYNKANTNTKVNQANKYTTAKHHNTLH